jgi:hypothetical protein
MTTPNAPSTHSPAPSARRSAKAPAGGRARKAPASELVRAEWLRRVQAEYRSAAITHHLVLWLIQLGASPDLIDAGLRIVKDELVHARLSHRVYTAAGGQDMPALAQETLGLRRPEQEPLWQSVARAGIEVFCLGETVAVPLFKVLRDGCTAPSARRALDRILRDEVRHRDFGWTLLDWLSDLPVKEVVHVCIRSELPRMFARLRRSYAPPEGATRTAIPAEDRTWGLMPPARYAQILERTVERDYVPRFAAHGIDARTAWEASRSAQGA